MTVDNPPIISSSIKKLILVSALLGYAALVLYLLYFVGLNELAIVVGKANIGIYFLAIASLIASFTFHSLVWYQLLRSLSVKLSFRRTYVLYWVGVFVDNLIPGGWSGDLFKAYLLNKDPTIQSGKAVASVVAKNVYEAIFNFSSLVFALILLFLNYQLEASLLISLGGIMLLLTLPLFVLLLGSFKPETAKKIINSIFYLISRLGRNRWNLNSLQKKAEKGLSDYHEGIKTLLENPRLFIKPMILSFIAWVFEVLTLLFVFASLAQFIALDKVVIVRSIAGNLEAQGYAFVGYAQIITSEIYGALGVPFSVAASVAILGGVVIFLLKTGISYSAFQYVVIAPHKGSKNKSKAKKEKLKSLREAETTQEQSMET